jgi:SAM-dependent methyltransferase
MKCALVLTGWQTVKSGDSQQWVPTASEAVACPLCGCADGPVVGRVGRHGVAVRNVACSLCGLVYVTPRPTPADLAEFYRSAYRMQHLIPMPTADGGLAAHGTPEHEEALAERGRVQGYNAIRIGGVRPGDRVLDVGCRRGLTLLAMRDQVPIEAVGIEPGETEAAIARDHGIEVHVGVLQTFDPGEATFDQVQMFHVLEHLPDPVGVLWKLRSFLKPDGRLVIEVPDVLQPYGGLGYFFQYPHLFSFSANSLIGLLRRARMRPIGMAYDGTLLIAATPEGARESRPRAFAPEMLRSPDQTGSWVAARLETYEAMEQLRRGLGRGETLPLAQVRRILQQPALPRHVVAFTVEIVERLSKRGMAAVVGEVLDAAATGPHEAEFVAMCQEARARIGALAS